MELNWSTFILEIINFLVLLWILKHFLYKPVLEVIARRRANIEKAMADAEARHTDAEALQMQYQARLGEWDKERQQARETLMAEIESERTRRMAELNDVLEQEREKARVAEGQRQADAKRKIEETALLMGARLSTRLLEQAAGPEVESRLVELVITELSKLPADQVKKLQRSYGKTPETIKVGFAFGLSEDQQSRLKSALGALTNAVIPIEFKQDRKLIAGLHITFGAWELGANFRDELRGFTELFHDQ